MDAATQILRWIRPALRRFPGVKARLASLDVVVTREKHELAQHFPSVIRPQLRLMHIAITAACNLRCIGCRYGRDFMPGKSLPMSIIRPLLEDASEAGVRTVRLYGGEPLLHKDLPEIIRMAKRLRLNPYITTNAILLGEKIDVLFEAGLRTATVGFYGDGETYDGYVNRPGSFDRLDRSIATVRQRYGKEVKLQINFLLCRPSCSRDSVRLALRFAEKYDTKLQVDLVHYSLPYFTEGPDHELQFTPGDSDRLESVVEELLDFRRRRPDLYTEAEASIRSIPDWALKGPAMRVPCTAYRILWVGADGTVQLCYVTFKLGDLNRQRLRDMLFTKEHKQAARDAFALNCPNCHCQRFERIETHKASLQMYADGTNGRA